MPLRRIYILCGIFCGLLSLILLRAFWLQIIEGSQYTQTSSNRLISIRYQAPRRGTIRDKNGMILAIDHPAFDLTFTPNNLPCLKNIVNKKSFRNPDNKLQNLAIAKEAIKTSPILNQIAKVLNIKKNKMHKMVMARIKKLIGRRRKNKKIIIVDKFPWSSQILIKGMQPQQAIVLETLPNFINAFSIKANSKRYYPQKQLASHIIGYMTHIQPNELDIKLNGDDRDKLIGRSGIEKFYDSELSGIPGKKIIEKIIDPDSNEVSWNTIKEEPAIGGRNINLTIDLKMQKDLQNAIGKQIGAAVLMDIKTGAILAMTSYPRFNPNLFIQAIGPQKKQRAKLLTSSQHPLINRAIQKYPPGSVFKLVTGLAGLESKTITAKSTVRCTGGYRIGNYTKHCWNHFGHGTLCLYQAIMHSCNPFFYDTSLKMGTTILQGEARKLGFGHKTGIDLPYEKQGLVPDNAWKRKHLGVHWVGGDTANLAIGQGYMQATPLQIARLMALVANGGYLLQPYLDQARQTTAKNLHIPDTYLKPLRKGLYSVVNVKGGTANRYRPNIAGEIAAKTSTAQSGGKRKPHAWFGGYYPVNNPQYSFVFMAEFAGSGGAICGSMAKRFFEAHYPKTIKN